MASSTGGDHWVTRIGPPFAPSLARVPDGTLLTGEVVAGAQSVQIVAPVEARDLVVAGGRYLALLPAEASAAEVFVLALDGAGAVVPWPVDEELKRTRLADADAECPACGSRAWDTVERRAEAGDSRDRLRAVVCHRCWLARRRLD